jgi:hypothetical protein
MRHCASVLLSVLGNRALAGHHRLAIDVFARLFLHAVKPQPYVALFARFFSALVAIAGSVGEADADFIETLHVVCGLPAVLTQPHVAELLRLVGRFALLRGLRFLARSLQVALTPFLGALMELVFAHPDRDEASIVLVELVVLCGVEGPFGARAIDFLLPRAETSANARTALLTLVAARGPERRVLPLLRVARANHEDPIARAIGDHLVQRCDIRTMPVKVAAGESPLGRRLARPPIEELATPAAASPFGYGLTVDAIPPITEFNAESIRRWFDLFEQACIERSPHSVLTEFRSLAQRCPAVARGIFPIAFHSNFAMRRPGALQERLLEVLRCPTTPADVVVALTAVVEFMDRAHQPVVRVSEWTSVFTGEPAGLRGALLQITDGRVLADAYASVGLLDESRQCAVTEWFVEPFSPRVLQALEAAPLALSSSIDQGLAELGQWGGPRFTQGFSAVLPSVAEAQQLRELASLDSSDFEIRLRSARDLFTSACRILLLRIDAQERRQNPASTERLLLLRLARKAGEWHVFQTFVSRFFPDIELAPPPVRLDYAKYLWERGDSKGAIRLLQALPQDRPTFRYHYALAVAREPHFVSAAVLHEVRDLVKGIDHLGCEYLWAWASAKLVHQCLAEYANDAIVAFAKCAQKDVRQRTSHVLQLVRLVNDRLDSKSQIVAQAEINKLPTHYFVGVVDHLIAAVRHKTERSRPLEILLAILERLLRERPYDVVFACLLSIEWDFILEDPTKRYESSFAQRVKLVCGECPETERAFNAARKIVHNLTAVGLPLLQVSNDAVMATLDFLKAHGQTVSDECRRFKRNCINPAKDRIEHPHLSDEQTRSSPLFREFERFFAKLRAWIEATPFDPNKALNIDDVEILHGKFYGALRQEVTGRLMAISPELAQFGETPPFFPMFGAPDVKIAEFQDEIRIMTSKERPRRFRVRGTDGHSYPFLLKSHEDLRNDDRLMQLCRLLNGVLRTPISTFAIVPLTSFSGIIQWVPNTITLFDLIEPQIKANHRGPTVGASLCPERDQFAQFFGKTTAQLARWDSFHPMGIHKLEAFRGVLRKWDQNKNALRDGMWFFAPDSETWLKYQANYSKSLAVMSIVGYLIGLGDRHLRNILLEQKTGRILHIDFGDLYEIAQNRSHVPEYVPFRLTRTIVSALGPCGYNGMFTKSCEETLLTVRQNRELILTMLEINLKSPTKPAGRMGFPGRSQSESYASTQTAKLRQSKVEIKIIGTDISKEGLTVSEHVRKLVEAAVNPYNLCRHFCGWHPWW